MNLLLALACAQKQQMPEEQSGIGPSPVTGWTQTGDTPLEGQISTMTAADDSRVFVVTNTGPDTAAQASVLETDGSVSASEEIPSGYYRSGATLNDGQIALPYSSGDQYGVRLFDPNTGKVLSERDFSAEEGVTGIDAVVAYGDDGYAFVYNNADYDPSNHGLATFNGSGLMLVDGESEPARDIVIDANNASSVVITGGRALVGTSGEYRDDGRGNPIPDPAKSGSLASVDLVSSETTFETSLPAGSALNGQVDIDALGRVFYVGADDQNIGAAYLTDGESVTKLNLDGLGSFISGGQILYASEDGNAMQLLVLASNASSAGLFLVTGNPNTNVWTMKTVDETSEASFAGGLVQVSDDTYAYSYAKPDGTSQVETFQFSR